MTKTKTFQEIKEEYETWNEKRTKGPPVDLELITKEQAQGKIFLKNIFEFIRDNPLFSTGYRDYSVLFGLLDVLEEAKNKLISEGYHPKYFTIDRFQFDYKDESNLNSITLLEDRERK